CISGSVTKNHVVFRRLRAGLRYPAYKSIGADAFWFFANRRLRIYEMGSRLLVMKKFLFLCVFLSLPLLASPQSQAQNKYEVKHEAVRRVVVFPFRVDKTAQKEADS